MQESADSEFRNVALTSMQVDIRTTFNFAQAGLALSGPDAESRVAYLTPPMII